jgi:hypothetical protein
MAIKPLKLEDMPPSRKYPGKLELLMSDIREAMKGRIEFWEFIDFPYSLKTGMKDVLWHAKKAMIRDLITITGVSVNHDRVPLTLYKRKDKDGNIHVYGHFNYELWDKLLEDMKGKANGRT